MAKRYKTLRQLDEQLKRIRQRTEYLAGSNLRAPSETPSYYDPETNLKREQRAGAAYKKYATRIINHFLGKDHYWYVTRKDFEPFYDTPVSSRIYLGLGNG